MILYSIIFIFIFRSYPSLCSQPNDNVSGYSLQKYINKPCFRPKLYYNAIISIFRHIVKYHKLCLITLNVCDHFETILSYFIKYVVLWYVFLLGFRSWHHFSKDDRKQEWTTALSLLFFSMAFPYPRPRY
jgi:hypothetical protein